MALATRSPNSAIDCDLATDSASFPRRSMQSVVLGLKDSVHQSLDPWLCHDCGDCSVTCPREAKPRESMKTLRRYLTAQYDWTGLSHRFRHTFGSDMIRAGVSLPALQRLMGHANIET